MGTHVKTCPPREGWEWLMRGVASFKRKPGEWFLLGNTYLFVLLFLSLLVPLLGPALVTLLTPGLGAGIVIAGKMASQGMRIGPMLLFAGFRQNNKKHLQPLIMLGVAHAVAFSLIKLLTIALFGAQPDVALTPDMMKNGNIPPEVMDYFFNTLMFTGVASIPVVLGFWFAPALVVWHDMPAAKALFSSWVAMWRNKGAFVIYGMGWFLINVGFGSLALVVLNIVGFPGAILGAVNIMLLAVVMSFSLATFYPSYQSVFESTPVSTREFVV